MKRTYLSKNLIFNTLHKRYMQSSQEPRVQSNKIALQEEQERIINTSKGHQDTQTQLVMEKPPKPSKRHLKDDSSEEDKTDTALLQGESIVDEQESLKSPTQPPQNDQIQGEHPIPSYRY